MTKTRRKMHDKKLTKRYSRKCLKGGNFQKDIAHIIAKEMLRNKIPILELERQGYPPHLIKLIEKELYILAGNTIRRYQRKRLPLTYGQYLINQVGNRRSRSKGDYDSELVDEFIENINENIKDNEPSIYNSHISPREFNKIKGLSHNEFYDHFLGDPY